MRIAFTTVPAPGHLNSTTTLARRLKARGHDVVFIAFRDAEPFVRAAQLPFIPYAEKDYPAGSVRKKLDQLSQLEGQAALEFTFHALAENVRRTLTNLPQTLMEARVDAVVLDQVQFGLGLVPMHRGMPYAHYSNAVPFDFSGSAPFCFFDWQHERTPEALARNREGLRKIQHALEPGRVVARSSVRTWRRSSITPGLRMTALAG